MGILREKGKGKREKGGTTDTTIFYNNEREKVKKSFVCILYKEVQIVVNTTDVTIFYINEREKIKKKIFKFFFENA